MKTTRSVVGWAIMRPGDRRPIRVFWGRYVAREEAKTYGAKVVRCIVQWDHAASARTKRRIKP
jgi:hypothetical protein